MDKQLEFHTYPHIDYSNIVQVTDFGNEPLTNTARLFFTDNGQATQIEQLVMQACKDMQKVNPNLGITPPTPTLTMIFGKGRPGEPGYNDLMDELEENIPVIYKNTDLRLYDIMGSVIIPDFEAPNDPSKQVTLKVDEYAGELISLWTPGKTKLVGKAAGDVVNFTWA